MSKIIQQLDAWHKTKAGYAVMAILELGLAYILASRAIDTGSWWQYLFTLIFFIGGIQNLVKLIRISLRKSHEKH